MSNLGIETYKDGFKEGYAEGFTKGFNEARLKSRLEIIRNFLTAHCDVQFISEMIGLPVEEVERLIREYALDDSLSQSV